MEQFQMMEQLKEFMAESTFPWAICGGFALDLFLNRNIRTHGDLDICVFEKDRHAVTEYVLSKGWQIYEFRGWGKVRPLKQGMRSDAGRNLMCMKDGCDLVKFYPCEEEGMLYHQFFHTGIKEFHYLEFLFNSLRGDHLVMDQRSGLQRELRNAILFRDSIPYLAPEIILLYKASDHENPDYQLDCEQTLPHLTDGQRTWFFRGMRQLYPDGHPWIDPGFSPLDGP